MAIQASDLEVPRVQPDVRIVERADGVSLLERTIVQHVVEHHRNTKRSDLNRVRHLVFQTEAQDELAGIDLPSSSDLHRNISR